MDAQGILARIRHGGLAASLAPIVLLVTATTGCVERSLRIESTPSGALVHLDGEQIGVTPVEVPFVYYGTRRLDVWMTDPAYDLAPRTEWVELRPAWYERFPFDLFTELLWPFPRTVERHHHVVLAPREATPPGGVDQLLEEAESARQATR